MSSAIKIRGYRSSKDRQSRLEGRRKDTTAAENDDGKFRWDNGVILREFSTKIHDPVTLCPVPIGRNPSKMCFFI
jgi:hypothetical protein